MSSKPRPGRLRLGAVKTPGRALGVAPLRLLPGGVMRPSAEPERQAAAVSYVRDGQPGRFRSVASAFCQRSMVVGDDTCGYTWSALCCRLRNHAGRCEA